MSVSVNVTVYFSTEGAKWTNCFLCFAFLYLFQGRDAVPQLLYLSRCDVQSVKLAARRALSSLGKIPRASHVGRLSRMRARILQLFSLLPKFDTLQTSDDYALEFQLKWIAFEQIFDTLLFYFCRRGRRRCPEEIDPVIKWNRRTYVLNDNLAWLDVKNIAFHHENWSDMCRIASN